MTEQERRELVGLTRRHIIGSLALGIEEGALFALAGFPNEHDFTEMLEALVRGGAIRQVGNVYYDR